MPDNDDGILLNLTPYEFKVKKPKHQNGDNTALHQMQPIKIKHKDVNKQKGLETSKKSKTKVSKDDKAVPKKYIDPKDFVPISNLFHKNPDIPSVPKLEVLEKRKEILFSSENVDDLMIGDKLKSNLKNHLNYTTLTEIQKLSIPLLLTGQDVMIKSPTGSGKTICYSLPIVDKLSKLTPPISRTSGPYVLVLVPTRELALQTLSVFQDLCKCCISIVPGMLIGGEKCKSEKARLRKGINILIATPGRLIYHMMETTCLDLSHIEFLVLDEADHLLDLGFREKIKQILEILANRSNVKRQSILLSATLNANIKDLISISLNEPVFVDSGGNDKNTEELDNQDYVMPVSLTQYNNPDYVMPVSLTQYFITVPAKLRLVSLVIFIIMKILSPKRGKALVFTSSRNSVVFLYNVFKLVISEVVCSTECKLFTLHGDMKQQQRFETFEKFKRSDSGILFCTDIASRGLDIKKVDWVIQYNCPTQTDDYLHRIGRTARIGETGSSVLFLMPSEVEYIKLLSKSSVVLSEIKLNNILKKFAEGKGNRSVEEKAQNLQNKIEESVSKSKDFHEKAICAYKSFIQGYATYPKDVKTIFHIKFLHLGHIAKSFGLRKAPINAIASAQKGKKRKFVSYSGETVKRARTDDFGEIVCGPRTKKERAVIEMGKKKKIKKRI